MAVEELEIPLGFSIESLGAQLDYAFQPIVNIHTGAVLGFEALVRGFDRAGYTAPHALLDAAFERGELPALEAMLRTKAFHAFAALSVPPITKLFWNIDSRSLEHDAKAPGALAAAIESSGLTPERVCLELSELHDTSASPWAASAMQGYRETGCQVAIDDYGTGFAGLKLLYEHPPELIKIDRFFIAGIANDHKKKLFVESIVDLAHVLGVQVVAEGVENRAELLVCREIGCDLAQGYFVARPSLKPSDALPRYAHVGDVRAGERRGANQDLAFLRAHVEPVPPLVVTQSMDEVFTAFRDARERSLLPVVDPEDRPLGIIRDADIKEFSYSAFGRDLLRNPSYERTTADFMRKVAIVDLHDSAERILDAYSRADSAPAVLVVDDFRYAGMLTAEALLRMIDEKNMALARDQNPLTRLPGNNAILDYVADVLSRKGRCSLVYFDLNHFKPFTDLYGFRQGDRVLILMAEILKATMGEAGCFCGHVGGDDYFAGTTSLDADEFVLRVKTTLMRFARDVESFYDANIRARGYIESEDRFGELRQFPLLSCSAAAVHCLAGEHGLTMDTLASDLAELKRIAKHDAEHIAVRAYAGDTAAPL